MSLFTGELIIDGAVSVMLLFYLGYLWRMRGNKTAIDAKLKKYKAEPRAYDTFKKVYTTDFIKIIVLLAASSILSVIKDIVRQSLAHVPALIELAVSLLGLATLLAALYLASKLFRVKK
jgi:hypothetical protein